MSGTHEQTEFEMEYQSLGKQPNYIAYQVTTREEGKKSSWTKIGVGFMHGDGAGVSSPLGLSTDRWAYSTESAGLLGREYVNRDQDGECNSVLAVCFQIEKVSRVSELSLFGKGSFFYEV